MINDIKTISMSDESKIIRKELWDTFTDALGGDLKSWIELIKMVGTLPMSAKSILFYTNFQRFLDGLKSDPKINRLFQEFLNNDEKRIENSKRIIQFIDSMDSDFKIDALLNLTRSVSHKFITKREYFKLSKLLEGMLIEDLEFLKENIARNTIEEMELTEEFTRSGLVYVTKSGSYAYSKMAFLLDKFALSYGSEKYKYNGEPDLIPQVFPVKQGIAVAITNEEIDRMFEKIDDIHTAPESPSNAKLDDIWIK